MQVLLYFGCWLLLLLRATTASAKSFSVCRNVSDSTALVASADLVVVGSGPGGAGFLYRLVRQRPNLTVLWIEKGRDFLARNWPQDIERVHGAVLTPVPRTKMWWLQAYAWNNFGGGDAANSGGPDYLGLIRDPPEQPPYAPVNVYRLRNHSVIPNTNTSNRWIKAFRDAEYKVVTDRDGNENNNNNNKLGPLSSRSPVANRVGLLSSLRTADGRERLLLANDLRYADNHSVTYVHARATSIVFDNDRRATGVRGVRMDGDQQEYGGCAVWKAKQAVVLAGGVFNTFDLLVESGIGPVKALEDREVPREWWAPNEKVGKGLGDEYPVVFLSVEPEKQDQYGAEPRLAAMNTDDSSFEMWSTGVFAWLRFKSFVTNRVLGTILPEWFPDFYGLLKWILTRTSMWGIGIDSEPVMTLVAISKPRNSTWSRKYKKNPLGIKIDDSAVQVTAEMCAAVTNALEPLKQGAKLQKQAKKKPSLARWVLAATSGLGLTNLLKPNAVTAQNVDKYTGRGKNKGKKCRLGMFASYYHFFGGNADVVDDSYRVQNTNNLYISDASVLRRLAPGAPSATVMETGMKVADAVIADLA